MYELYKHWAELYVEQSEDLKSRIGPDSPRFLSLDLGKHYLLNLPEDADEDSLMTASHVLSRLHHAAHFFLDSAETTLFTQHLKTPRLKGFAGELAPDIYFPLANFVYDVGFNPGAYPIVVPKRDNIAFEHVRVKRMSIFCNHNQLVDPHESTANEWAQVVAFIEDATGALYTYSGIVYYGYDGARMYPAPDIKQLFIAYRGDNPVILRDGMTNMSQFVCGMLANLNDFTILRTNTIKIAADSDIVIEEEPKSV